MESLVNIWDSSDRRTTWENWVLPSPGLEDVWVSKDLQLSGCYFLEENMRSLHLERANLSIHIYCSRFEGGRWSRVRLDGSEMVDVVFRNVFLEGVDFSKCVLKRVRFEACVLKECQIPKADEDFANWSQAECLWLDKPEEVPPQVVASPAGERPAPPKEEAKPQGIDPRFAGLE